MNNWGQLGVFDLETTGVDVDTARIVSACIAILRPDGSVVARWDWLADPGIEIPAGASAVHGITTERARSLGRHAKDVVAEISQSLRVLFALDIPLVVYNAPYDLTLLDRECRRHGIEPLAVASPVIDPLVLDKFLDKFRKGKRTLEAAAALYGVELDEAHDAGADAIAAGRVALALGAAYPDQLDVSPAELHASQVTWYADQAVSFADYIRRVKGDKDFVADTTWPVRTTDLSASIQDTQPIAAPSPRPSLRVPHLDFDTGVLVFDRVALEAAPVRASASVSEVEAVQFDDVEPAIAPDEPTDTVVPDEFDRLIEPDASDSGPEAGYEPLMLVEPFVEEQPASGDEPDLLWNVFDLDAPANEPGPDAEPASFDQQLDLDPVSADSDNQDAAPPARPTLRPTVLRVAAAIITDPDGRTLLVRKRGSSSFMQAGGKIERGESAVVALSRELLEEIGLELDLDETEYLGSFRAEAANESDTVIRAEVFAMMTSLTPIASGEIEELIWIDNDEPAGIELAPLTRDTILPLWVTRRASRF
ncbi:MAG: exonuclease domain-containing protein [Rhodoglobus sp.]